MQKKFTALFLVFSLLGAIFYTINCSRFGKQIVGWGGLVWCALIALFFILTVIKATIPAVISLIPILALQILIVLCWWQYYILPFFSIGRLISIPLTNVLSGAVGIIFHMFLFVLGIFLIRNMLQMRVKKAE